MKYPSRHKKEKKKVQENGREGYWDFPPVPDLFLVFLKSFFRQILRGELNDGFPGWPAVHSG